MNLAIPLRTLPLFLVSAFEMIVPFVRAIIFTHLLPPYEFGFASALAATDATFAQITDIAIFRFVNSSPRSVYVEAVAAAHAISILRGFCVGGLLLLASPAAACALATCDDWPSFAWLAPVTIIRSFEHLEICVVQRDYRYWPQLIASVASHGCGLVALCVIVYEFKDHYAFIAYLLVQAPVYVLASHLLASHRYRANHRTPFFRKAFAFSLPLVLNGIGLAIVSQGDRWIVGSLMGLPFLGLYVVVTLGAYVPIGGLQRILGPILFAGLHNAVIGSGQYDARLKLFSRAIPAIGALYALSLIAFFGFVLPTVFGDRYVVSDLAIVLLALIVFLRLTRYEPQTSLMLNSQNTRKLALANQAPLVGLVVTAGLAVVHPTLEFILVGGLIGELAGLCTVGYLTRRLLRSAIYDHVFTGVAMLVIVLSAGVLTLSGQSPYALAGRIVIAGGFMLVVAVYSGFSLSGPLKKAYPARRIVAGSPPTGTGNIGNPS